ncbi:hypothetical protein PENTCL1PPCAC_28367 [Pristionchus entomophagus]|uniref:alpha,alpha-trehalose-phosphate synthase (UDP-forming) n=1 Tax=Pristionchus entomophagus TaxID=358040 RepID=A0AAV5UIP9_9BILA|nr:hypothetical protein PENTCL1PPCAC_28367 [Pristionchus entomophagus]
MNGSCERNGSAAVRSASPSVEKPFQRATKDPDVDVGARAREYCSRVLERMGEEAKETGDILQATEQLALIWKKRNKLSEIAFDGLLAILELCLLQVNEQVDLFSRLINSLAFNTVSFWKLAVPRIYDSDLSHGTAFRETLLFSLALYDVNNGKNRLRELYAAVPGVRQSMLGIHAKKFGEKYRHMQMSRSRASSRLASREGSCEDLLALDNDVVVQDDSPSSDQGSDGLSASAGAGSAASGHRESNSSHHRQRVINVSNAPPVSLTRKDSGLWEIKQGSGGLVACVDPVMSEDHDNIWLANLGLNFEAEKSEQDLHMSTNSLGLPIIQQARAGDVFHVIEENDKKIDGLTDKQKDVERDMSLLSVLNDYNRSSYKLNPVFVSQDDYNSYYGGISNGLLWPALHNLPEHVVKDYDDPKVLNDHWCAYVRVNYHFGLNAVRNARPQDFIWIHDYHLMLTGQIMRSLDSNLEVGFFLHIPFQPPPEFLTKYKMVGEPILRGVLRFNKVGFQTHRDRAKFLELVHQTLPRARIAYEDGVDIHTVSFEGWTCSLGVFPVSIKNEDFLAIANEPQTVIKSQEIKSEMMKNSGDGGSLFFSVERFDYTKGILEKLKAWKRYFDLHPERKGLDVLYQIAVTNRRTVESYRKYQDDCIALADEIKESIRSDEHPDWRCIRFDTDGLQRIQLIAHYLAMDVGVVTPAKDGMNLVAKEMMVCNPSASLMLSSGAGTEVQLGMAGFYKDEDKCYHRVEDIADVESFARTFYEAALKDKESRKRDSERINQFVCAHGIDEWSTAFLDPSWTHEVIRPSEVRQLADFYMLMNKTAQVRRQIVEVVLKGMPVKHHFAISLENAKNALEKSCEANTTRLVLDTTANAEDPDGANLTATFDISDELDELTRDLAFLQFVQEDDINNVEQFIDTLGSFHPSGPAAYQEEVDKACALLTKADHFHFFFTDRDGTLKSYSCSYPTSIQPAYSAVIQAQFARRCAQFCAIVTTAPLVHIGILNMSTMPEGSCAYGASGGREWYLNPALQFKDDTVSDQDLALLNKAFEKVEDLLENPEFRNFTWIGSGLQKHFGHITVAKQDNNNSIPHRKSVSLYENLARIVHDVDPMGHTLTLREGELDLKIFTKAKLSGRIFNKGHGIRLIERKMGLKLTDGNILVCGDSETDIPMLEECLLVAPANVYTIWVTTDDSLKQKVSTTCSRFGNTNVEFVSSPKVLLGAMGKATIRELTIRGLAPFHFDDDDHHF